MSEIVYHTQISKVIEGRYCDFIEDSNGKPASPIFGNYAELTNWMRENGWVRDEYDSQGNNFDPWRVSKVENCRCPRH